MTTPEAPIGKLGKKDFQKALITAGLVGGLSAIFPMLSAPTIVIGVVAKAFGVGFSTGFIGYLLKNLATNSEDKFLTKEPPPDTPTQ